MAADLYALARHATGTGNGTLIQTVQPIRHQQVRGSSLRVGSNIINYLRRISQELVVHVATV